MLKMRITYQSLKPFLVMMLTDLKATTVFKLPGEVVEVQGFKKEGARAVGHTIDGDIVLTGAWLVTPQDVPEDAQPQPRSMLHRSLDPILSLRATGETIRPGEIPGSVIKSMVEGAQRAIKSLAEYEMELPARKGRPSRALQKLYDLPVQKTLAASFEVQFRSPLSEPDLF